ncbi:MAG TPA: hypothetical protein VF158_01250 [Longimicrobiales bacterium]
MEELYRSLLELQALDEEIATVEARLAGFAPRLEEVEAPVVALERELEAGRKRLEELRETSRRLNRAAEDKRVRLNRTEERLERVRNAREEAAIRTELHLIRTAVDADEAEAIEVMEELRRTELKQDELEKKLGRAREEMEPKRAELLEARGGLEQELAALRDRRENRRIRLDPDVARLYERVRAGRTRVVITSLTPDGACGHCFGVIPLQQQWEIRRATSLVRCEACGVILTPGE